MRSDGLQRSARLCCGALLAFAILSSSVAAQTVVLVQPDARDAKLVDVYHRLQAELRIHQLEALEIEWSAAEGDMLRADSETELASLAQERGGFAAIALLRRQDHATVDVWLNDRSSSQPGVLTLDAGQTEDAASLLALRAVDLLRMHLNDRRPPLEAAEKAPQPSAADEPEVAAQARESSKFWISASALVLRPGQRFGFGVGPLLGFMYRPLSWLELAVQVAGPIAGSQLDTAQGQGTMHQELAWLEARGALLRVGGLRVALSLGTGAYFLQAYGEVDAPLQGRDAQVWSWLVSGGAHVSYALSPRIALGLAVRALALLPRVGVAVFREEARIDLPAFESSLGIAIGL